MTGAAGRGRWLGTAVAAAAAAQVAPAATWLPGLRPRALAGAGEPGSVALTFDDGPDPRGTPAVLDACDRLGLRATFFVLGTRVRRDPGLLREVAARGHEVAVHGDEHRYLIARTPQAAYQDLVRARDTVAEVLGVPPRWWRPPYGVMSGPALLAARRLRVRPVLWTAWGREWRPAATPESVIARLTRRGLAGATLLLHDSDLLAAPGTWQRTVAALPPLAERIAAAGLRPQRLSEHVGGAGRRPPVDPATRVSPADGSP